MATTGTNFGDDALADEQGLAPSAMPDLPAPAPATPTLAAQPKPVGPGRHLLTGLVGVLIDGLQAGMQAPMSAQGPSQAAAMGAQMPAQRQQQQISLASQQLQLKAQLAQSRIQDLQTKLLASKVSDELADGLTEAGRALFTKALEQGTAKMVSGTTEDAATANAKLKELHDADPKNSGNYFVAPGVQKGTWGVWEIFPKNSLESDLDISLPGSGSVPDDSVHIPAGTDMGTAKVLMSQKLRDHTAKLHDETLKQIQAEKSKTALDVAGIRAKTAAAKAAVPKPEKPQDMVIGTVSGRQVAGTMDDLKAIGATSMTKAGAAESEKIQNARSMMNVFDSNDPDDPGLVQLAAKLDQEGKLGPAATRFQNWLNAGKTLANFDAGDPDVQRLFTKLGLSTTGLMQVHVGARGSAQLLEHFEKLANAKTMSATAFRTALETENRYIRMKAMIPARDGGAGRAAASAGRAPAPPTVGEVRNGYKYKGGNPADPNSWIKAKK